MYTYYMQWKFIFSTHFSGTFSLYSFPKQALVFTCLHYKPIENTVGKGEIALKEQFLLSHSVFYWYGEVSAIFMKFKIVVCIHFEFGSV